MSVKLMAGVFALDVSAAEKLLLLAMADHGRDDGTGIYPSIGTLARKSSMTPSGVHRILKRLKRSGLVVAGGRSRFFTIEYSIVLPSDPGSPPRSIGPLTSKPRGSDPGGPAPVTQGHQTTDHGSPDPSRTTNSTIKRTYAAARLSPRSSQPSRGKKDHRARYSMVGKLAEKATELLQANQNFSDGDLAEELKTWAARQGMPYFDAWPGAASPIEQAILIAGRRERAR